MGLVPAADLERAREPAEHLARGGVVDGGGRRRDRRTAPPAAQARERGGGGERERAADHAPDRLPDPRARAVVSRARARRGRRDAGAPVRGGRGDPGGRELVRPGRAALDRPRPERPRTSPSWASTFGFHPLALEDCAHEEQRPKFEQYPASLFSVVHRLAPDAGRHRRARARGGRLPHRRRARHVPLRADRRGGPGVRALRGRARRCSRAGPTSSCTSSTTR